MYGKAGVEKFVSVDEPPFLFANPYDTEDEILAYGGNHIDVWHVCHALESDWENGMKAFNRYFAMKLYAPYENLSNLVQVYDPTAQISKDRAFFLSKLLVDHLQQDWRDVISEISVPTLYVVGNHSHATTAECVEWMKSTISNIKVVQFNGEDHGTHNLMVNSPAKFNKVVIDFLLG